MRRTVYTYISKDLYNELLKEKKRLKAKNKCGKRKRRITLYTASQSLMKRIK